MVEYLPKYEGCAKEKWLHMYINWCSWETIEKMTILDPLLCPIHFPKISSVAVSSIYVLVCISTQYQCSPLPGHHVAVGSEDGRLKIFTKHWQPFFEHRIVAVKLTKLTFIGYNDYCSDDLNDLNMCLVVAFPKGLSIIAFKGIQYYQFDIFDIKSHRYL